MVNVKSSVLQCYIILVSSCFPFFSINLRNFVPLLWLLTEPCRNCLLDFSVRLGSLSLECLLQWSKDIEVTGWQIRALGKGGALTPHTSLRAICDVMMLAFFWQVLSWRRITPSVSIPGRLFYMAVRKRVKVSLYRTTLMSTWGSLNSRCNGLQWSRK